MSPEWNPGDVAVVPFPGRNQRALYTKEGWVRETGGSPIAGFAGLRPLVVIDPEDVEQVERLCDRLYGDHKGGVADRVRHALREFANPKPEEPTGLGAVVEDANGDLWLRVGGGDCPWRAAPSDSLNSIRKTWDSVTAVRVLSEGVTP